jgi:soluble lytic murein transglycosylase-like protein
MRPVGLHLGPLVSLRTVAVALACSWMASAPAGQPEPVLSVSRIDACVARAAQYHHVNAAVLRAILRVESSFNPGAVGRNADGTVDLGIAQINSRHLPLLARHGIQPGHLMDGCIGGYVAAWHLSTLIAAHGNSWATIARYHSATPSLNLRYQVLLANELNSAGVISGRKAPVPVTRRALPAHHAAAGRDAHALVFDEAPAPISP